MPDADTAPPARPPIPEAATTLLWEQWKYRHEFFWKAFYTVVVTTAVISTVPLFKSDIIESLGVMATAFPLLGLAFGGFGRSLLNAEYRRLSVVGDAYTTSPWNYGASRVGPFPTTVGKPIGELLRPAMFVALYMVPAACLVVTALLAVQEWFTI
jgi:hypothetical protein